MCVTCAHKNLGVGGRSMTVTGSGCLTKWHGQLALGDRAGRRAAAALPPSGVAVSCSLSVSPPELVWTPRRAPGAGGSAAGKAEALHPCVCSTFCPGWTRCQEGRTPDTAHLVPSCSSGVKATSVRPAASPPPSCRPHRLVPRWCALLR